MSDVMEVYRKRKEFEIKHPILSVIKDLQYMPFRFWIKIEMFFRDIRSFFNRGRRGWDKTDVWNFNTYISKIISESLRYLKNNSLGYIDYKFGQSPSKNLKRCDNILDEIIWSFDMYYKCSNSLEYSFNMPWKKSGFTTKEEHYLWVTDYEKEFNLHVLTDLEEKRMRAGMKLFLKYFDSLWD